MNIIAIRLVLVGTISGLVVMCKILTVRRLVFIYAHINSTFLGHDSLPLVLTMIQYYSVKQKHTSTVPGSLDWKSHSRNYVEIIRIHH